MSVPRVNSGAGISRPVRMKGDACGGRLAARGERSCTEQQLCRYLKIVIIQYQVENEKENQAFESEARTASETK